VQRWQVIVFFVGQIIAAVSISVGTNCDINGRTIAAAAVTFAGADSIVLPLFTIVPTATGAPTNPPTNQIFVPTMVPTNAPTTDIVVISDSLLVLTSKPASTFSGPGYICNVLTYTKHLTKFQDGVISFNVTVDPGIPPYTVCPIITQIILNNIPALLDPPCDGNCVSCQITTLRKRDFLAIQTPAQLDVYIHRSGTNTGGTNTGGTTVVPSLLKFTALLTFSIIFLNI